MELYKAGKCFAEHVGVKAPGKPNNPIFPSVLFLASSTGPIGQTSVGIKLYSQIFKSGILNSH